MTRKQTYENRLTFGGVLLQPVIVFLICVVFPGAVTFVAPATWLTFERRGEEVRCKTWTCMFFEVLADVSGFQLVRPPEYSSGS